MSRRSRGNTESILSHDRNARSRNLKSQYGGKGFRCIGQKMRTPQPQKRRGRS